MFPTTTEKWYFPNLCNTDRFTSLDLLHVTTAREHKKKKKNHGEVKQKKFTKSKGERNNTKPEVNFSLTILVSHLFKMI